MTWDEADEYMRAGGKVTNRLWANDEWLEISVSMDWTGRKFYEYWLRVLHWSTHPLPSAEAPTYWYYIDWQPWKYEQNFLT